MPKFMSPEIQRRTAEKLKQLYLTQNYPFAVVLHGGEPLLLGISKLRYFFDGLRNALPPSCTINIQTNGVLIRPEVLDLCSEFGVGLSISLDGPAEIHDKYRVSTKGQPSHAQVLAGVKKLQQHRNAIKLFSGVLSVVDPESSPDDIYDYFKTLEVPSIDFLYRDGNRSKLPYGKKSVVSIEYGRWMSVILDRYLADPRPPRIRLLDDMMKLLLGGAGTKEGVGLTDFGIVVIDTDGSVTKSDTLKSSPAGDRFTEHWNVRYDDLCEVVLSPEFSAYHMLQRPTSSICTSCPELAVCGGGMLAHRYDDANGYDNPSVFCSDQKALIERMRKYLYAYFSRAAVA